MNLYKVKSIELTQTCKHYLIQQLLSSCHHTFVVEGATHVKLIKNFENV